MTLPCSRNGCAHPSEAHGQPVDTPLLVEFLEQNENALLWECDVDGCSCPFYFEGPYVVAMRILPDGRLLMVERQIVNFKLSVSDRLGAGSWSRSWEYEIEKGPLAVVEAVRWEGGLDEPEHWIRSLPSYRRREYDADGRVTTETADCRPCDASGKISGRYLAPVYCSLCAGSGRAPLIVNPYQPSLRSFPFEVPGLPRDGSYILAGEPYPPPAKRPKEDAP